TKPDGTIDPTKPTRVTEVQVIIRLSQTAWSSQNFRLTLSAISINPYCPAKGSNVTFRLQKHYMPPPPPPPPTVTMPSVLGQTLDKAENTLYGLGLTHLTVVGPYALPADQKVDAQDPQAGKTVKLTDGILLSTSRV